MQFLLLGVHSYSHYLRVDIPMKEIVFENESKPRNHISGGGGGKKGASESPRFPYHVLPPPVVLCPFASRLPPFIVLLCLQVNQEDQKPGFNFQTVPKLDILVHFLAFVLVGDHWFPMKVTTGQFS